MTSLFPTTTTTSSSSSTNSNRVEFKVGKCLFDGKMVTPDHRKGLLFIKMNPSSINNDHGDDGDLPTLCWKDRTTNKVEDELIMFPEDAELSKVKNTGDMNKDNNRVFVLQFKSSTQKHFFWSQEPKVESDEKLVNKINQIINGIPEDAMEQDEEPAPPRPETIPQSPNKKVKIESSSSSVVPSTTVAGGSSSLSTNNNNNGSAATSSSVAQSDDPNMKKIRELIASMNANNGFSGQQQLQDINLLSLFTPSNISPVLQDEESVKELLSCLPDEVEKTKFEIQETIKSPQFSHSVRILTAALRSGQGHFLISQLGLPDPQTDVFGVRALLYSIEEQIKQEQKKSSSSKN